VAAYSSGRDIAVHVESDQLTENVEAAGKDPDAKILVYSPKPTTSMLCVNVLRILIVVIKENITLCTMLSNLYCVNQSLTNLKTIRKLLSR